MRSMIQQLSGNAFTVKLTPESETEKAVLINGTDQDTIGMYYQEALRDSLGEHIKPASITPDENYPYSATLELIAESGSI